MDFPAPIDTPSAAPLRWGIVAPGEIAGVFASAVNRHGRQKLVAVASRSSQRAREFAETHGIDHSVGSYQELFDSPDVDALYIASHIGGHLELAEGAVEAGKHVLVEKPLHYSSAAATRTLAKARGAGILMTEAMWTRYLPQSSVITQIVDSDEFGEPEHLLATFAVDNRRIDRLWRPNTGGITYDMGIYPIALAHQIFGQPSRIDASGEVTGTGMDQASIVRLSYPSGATATLVISGVATFPCSATISGQNYALTLEHPFFVPTVIRLTDKELYSTSISWSDGTAATGHDGLYYQAEWFAQYVDEGRVESPLHTHAEISSNLEVAEEISRALNATVSTE